MAHTSINPKTDPIRACSTVSTTRLAVSPTVAPGTNASAIPPSQTGAIATKHPAKDAVTCAAKRLAGTKIMIRPMCTAFVCARLSASSSLRSTRPAVSTRRRTRSLRPNANAILSTSHKNRIACSNCESTHKMMSGTSNAVTQRSRNAKGAHNCVETDAQCVGALVHEHQGHRGEQEREERPPSNVADECQS